MKFGSILSNERRQRARTIIEAIACDLPRFTPTHANLGSGLCGHALFYAYHASSCVRSKSRQLAEEMLERAIGSAFKSSRHGGLFGGDVGIGWTVAHLVDHADAEGILKSVDRMVTHLLDTPRWVHDYDLISGLAGIGVYALERWRDPCSVSILDRVLGHLEALAAERDVGFTWHTPPHLLVPWQREQARNGYDNLGLAHGVAGVVAFLARLVPFEQYRPRCERLLAGSIDWLLSRELSVDHRTRFAAWEQPDVAPAASRIAWCYGDPGIAVALFLAAQAMKREDWRDTALRIARAASAHDAKSGGVMDAALCHGAFGLALIFARLYDAGGGLVMQRAALKWLDYGMAVQRPGEGVGGYLSYAPGPYKGHRSAMPWVEDPGFLTGSAGIGLALMSLLDSEVSGWDRPLLTALGDSVF